jgi:hypothetical protein
LKNIWGRANVIFTMSEYVANWQKITNVKQYN